jgi:dihydrofolate synthase/folylpolyglutamate synthase
MIRIDGRRITVQDLDHHLATVTARASAHRSSFGDGQPSQYALVLMAAYAHFIESKVDIVVAEGAIGGRFDPTAVPNALMTVMTSISNDHAEKLGARAHRHRRKQGACHRRRIRCHRGAASVG